MGIIFIIETGQGRDRYTILREVKRMESVMFGGAFSTIWILAKLVFMVLVVYYLAKIAKK